MTGLKHSLDYYHNSSGYHTNNCSKYLQSDLYFTCSLSVGQSQVFASSLCTLNVWDLMCLIALRGPLSQYGIDHVTWYVIQQIQIYFLMAKQLNLQMHFVKINIVRVAHTSKHNFSDLSRTYCSYILLF